MTETLLLDSAGNGVRRPHQGRAFILGAGFSKPSGMPLATDLLPLLADDVDDGEMREWLNGVRESLEWLSDCNGPTGTFKLNIEEVFHYAHFDIEVHRLRQQLVPVGRGDGPRTPWRDAESVAAWLSHLEESLHDVIFHCESDADLAPINRWAESVDTGDTVLTFNYDTLAERALAALDKPWNHGTGREGDTGIPVYKLHGSIDWIVADRSETFSKLDLLFEKENTNRSDRRTNSVEDDRRLWRCRTREQLENWIGDRELQSLPAGAMPRTVGIAGLGAYKQLHQIPGLGQVWASGMRALYNAEQAIVAGFSMSDFDAFAKMQFAEIARQRIGEGRPLRVAVIDPGIDEAVERRFRQVFRCVDFVARPHQEIDWSQYRQSS